MASQKSIQPSPRRSPRHSAVTQGSVSSLSHPALPHSSCDATAASPGTAGLSKQGNSPARRSTGKQLPAAQSVPSANLNKPLSAVNSSADVSGRQYAKTLPRPATQTATKSVTGRTLSASSQDAGQHQELFVSPLKTRAQLRLQGMLFPTATAKLSLQESSQQAAAPVTSEAHPDSDSGVVSDLTGSCTNRETVYAAVRAAAENSTPAESPVPKGAAEDIPDAPARTLPNPPAPPGPPGEAVHVAGTFAFILARAARA